MAITFILNNKAVNDQTVGLQTGDSADGFTDTDVAYSSLPAAFRTYLETTLGLASTFPTSIGVATMANSVTVNASAGSSLTGIVFTDGSGGTLNGDDSLLDTIDGKSIFLFADGPNTVIGKYDSDGDTTLDAVAFVIRKEDNLNAAGTQAQVTFNVVTYAAIKHNTLIDDNDDAVNLGNTLKLAASEKVTFSFGGTPSGNHLFTMVQAGSFGLVVTPETEVVKLHISQGGGPTTLGMFNQMIDPGEDMVFTFVNNPNTDFTVPNLSQGEADDETKIDFGSLKTVIGGSVSISQTQGNDPAALVLTAFSTVGTTETDQNGFIAGYSDDNVVTISAVRVKFGTTTLTFTADGTDAASGVSVDFNPTGFPTGTVKVSGLQDDYVVEYDAAAHERLKVTGVGGKFDIGGVGIASTAGASEFVGQQIVIEDDGPTAPTLAALTSVTHDETAGVQSGTSTSNPNAQDDIAGSGLPAGVLALFNAIGAAAGSDPGVPALQKDNGAIGFAKGAGALVSLTGGGFGTDGAAASGSVIYDLSVSDGTFSGLSTTEGTQIFLYEGTGTLAGLILGRVGTEAGTTDTADPNGTVAFALTVDSSGTGYIAHYLSVNHGTGGSTPAAYDNEVAIDTSAVQITVKYTDRDGDTATSTPVNIGNLFKFQDDGPRITVTPPSSGSPLVLDNSLTPPISNTGGFGYDLGSDDRVTYSSSSSDFVDSNGSAAGIQLALSGEVGTGANKTITDATVDLTGTETASSATFNFSFKYDTDPLTSGQQAATATGTLSFNKVNDTFTVTLDNAIQGFSFDVLHTSELLEKNPTSNTGHPPLVVQKLATDFFVQFTADETPFGFSTTGDAGNTGDTAFTGADHDLAGGTETWVSATQSTNGVAGDTIQKDELLTLRFFGEDILSDATPPVTEKTNPTTTADGIAVKFDGIGNSEDLIVILDLIDDQGTANTADDVEITRAVIVENGDFFKNSTPGGVPAPYNTEFTLDNNDGLVIIEGNDYNGAGENFKIQGVQIMQSANGLTGSGINLNKTTGAGGSSSGTQSFDPADNDVLKITDIGFIRTESGTQDAHLDFSLQLVDADGDLTAVQHLFVDVLNP